MKLQMTEAELTKAIRDLKADDGRGDALEIVEDGNGGFELIINLEHFQKLIAVEVVS